MSGVYVNSQELKAMMKEHGYLLIKQIREHFDLEILSRIVCK